MWRHACDEIASCWSCNKLSLETYCNTIPFSKHKMGWSWLCVLVCRLWSLGVYVLHCYWGVGSSASTAGEKWYTPEPSNHSGGDGKVCAGTSSSESTAWEEGRQATTTSVQTGNLSIFLLRLQLARVIYPDFASTVRKGWPLPSQTGWQQYCPQLVPHIKCWVSSVLLIHTHQIQKLHDVFGE